MVVVHHVAGMMFSCVMSLGALAGGYATYAMLNNRSKKPFEQPVAPWPVFPLDMSERGKKMAMMILKMQDDIVQVWLTDFY
jgi:hypothetical protein